jgi:hypothetical protein
MSTDERWIIQTPDRQRFLRPDGQWDPDPSVARRWSYPEARQQLDRVQRDEVPHAMIAGLAAE